MREWPMREKTHAERDSSHGRRVASFVATTSSTRRAEPARLDDRSLTSPVALTAGSMDSLFDAPGRIRRASIDDVNGVIQRRVDEKYAAFAANQPATKSTRQKLDDYLLYVHGEIEKLPEGSTYVAFPMWSGAVQGLEQLVDPISDDAAKEFVADYVDALVDVVNAAFDAAEAPIETETEGATAEASTAPEDEWVPEAGKLATKTPNGARDDLETLLASMNRGLHQKASGTLAGGNKKVAHTLGLKHDSARIDAQTPTKDGRYNIQFQISGASLCGVIFTSADAEADVKKAFMKAFDDLQKLVSPSALAIQRGVSPTKEAPETKSPKRGKAVTEKEEKQPEKQAKQTVVAEKKERARRGEAKSKK
jgi:hypothetical protein